LKECTLSVGEIAQMLWQNVVAAVAQPKDVFALVAGAIAAVLIVVSAFVKTIIPLRWLAVGSNVGFVIYGIVQPAWLVLALHLTLLPVNVWRAVEMVRLTRRVARSAQSGDTSGVWLRPYMRTGKHKAGEVLFRKGDMADHLYFLAEGQIQLVELDRTIEPGRVFGEIAFFAPDRRRTNTARCIGPCTILRIDEVTFRQLYFQNPDFGFEVVRLIATRLSADVSRLEHRLGVRDDAPMTAGSTRSPLAPR
jgi:CRP/FNR family transcriptional regulator, cyclic AMP receptor protein